MNDRGLLWVGRLALGFVLLALLALVVTPLLVQRHVDRLAREMDDTGPARTLISRIEFDLAHEMAALRGFLIAGDTAFLRVYHETVQRQREAFAQLEPYADQLGPQVVKRFAETRALALRWNESIENANIVERRLASPSILARIPTEQSLYERALRSTQRLDQAVLDAARRRAASIYRAERTSMIITLALGGLALLAAGVVGWFAHRVRMLGQETARALNELAHTTEARNRLLRGVTHDVKNPLGAADGYAELLLMGLRGPLLPEQATLVAGVRRSVRSALDIIGDLLDLARAETGALRVDRVPADLLEVVRDAAEDHRGAAEAAGHTLELRLDGTPLQVYTDPARVRQVLGNLLSNAVKYTPRPGHIVVDAAETADGGPRPGRWLAVRVVDNGPGIPPDQREAIFTEFKRLHPGEIAGHGLGLAISRRIAHLLGGDISVAGEQGAVFTLWLPSRAEAKS